MSLAALFVIALLAIASPVATSNKVSDAERSHSLDDVEAGGASGSTIEAISRQLESGGNSTSVLAELYLQRGDLLAQQGRYNEATPDYDRAIELRPNLAKAYSHRGVVRSRRGDLDQAIEDFSAAIALGSGDIDLYKYYNNRGRAWSTKGVYDRAVRDYDQATALNSEVGTIYILRGDAWLNLHDVARSNSGLRSSN